MAWELRENADGSWAWEAFQSAYGLVSGCEPTLAEATVRLALGESELVEDPVPPVLADWMLAHCDDNLKLMAEELVTAVGRQVFPRDPDGFRASVRSR